MKSLKKKLKFKYVVLYPIGENPNRNGSNSTYVAVPLASFKEAKKEVRKWCGAVIVKILFEKYPITTKGMCE